MSNSDVFHSSCLLSAAAPVSVTALLPMKIKRTAAFDFSKAAVLGVTMLYCTTAFFLLPSCGSSLILNYCAETGAGLGILLRMLVKFRLTIFLNTNQRSIPGGIRVGKVTDCINVNGSVCAPQEAH